MMVVLCFSCNFGAFMYTAILTGSLSAVPLLKVGICLVTTTSSNPCVFISCDHWSNGLQTVWLKTKTQSFTESKLRCGQGWCLLEALRENLSPVCGCCQQSLVLPDLQIHHCSLCAELYMAFPRVFL